jgi:hypothetical protein
MHSSSSKRRGFLAALVFIAVAVPLAVSAQERAIHVGGVVGPNFNQLNGPTDPEGDVTVLGGTAFTGSGVTGGATGAMELVDVPFGALFVEANLLLSHHRGTGFAESRTTGQRQELTLSTNILRLPAFARYDILDNPISIRFGLGPELLLGLGARHSTRGVGIDPPSQENFDARATTHFALSTKLGLTYQMSGLRIPLDLRFTWDPMVPKSTRDRLVGYQSYDEPGAYQVAYNYQLLVGLGVEFDLGSQPATE